MPASLVGPMSVPAAPDNVVEISVDAPSPAPAGLAWPSGDAINSPPPPALSAPPAPDAGQSSAASLSVSGPSQPPHDRFKDHVALAEADIRVNGVSMREFALADAGANKILVKVGVGGQWAELGSAQGVDAPQSVVLADLNGDGIPDLIVANSGANNILVFPGRPDGQLGPEVNGGNGFGVGADPVGVTVGDINGDGVPDLIVANKGSDSLSILQGQDTGTDWTLTVSSTIRVVAPAPDPVAATMTASATTAPSFAPVAATTSEVTMAAPAPAAATMAAPVKTVLYDLNHDGLADLFVCNSGSNDVYMYQGQSNGTFDTTDPIVFAVGLSPVEMFVGRFDKRPQLDLVTVNSGSDDLTFIGGVLLPHPTTVSISSGGITPDAAFAVDPTHAGVMDLVVANSGDGRLAVFRAANEGMQLAGVITRADIPVPTGLAPASWGPGGIDFLAAGAGQDAAELLHFDLGIASPFLATPLDVSSSTDGSDGELFAQLVSFDDSSLELLAVYWDGGPDSRAIAGEWGLRESSTMTALYSPTEGQGADESTPTSDVRAVPPRRAAAPSGPPEGDLSALDRFVFGLDAALNEPRAPVEAVAARDAREMDGVRSVDALAQFDRRPIERARDRPFDPDVEAAAGAVDEALRLFWSEGQTSPAPEPVKPVPRFDPIREPEGSDAATREGRMEPVPAVSSAVLLATRLILRASPPRPPSFRRKPDLRPFDGIWGAGPGRDRPDRV